MIYKIKITSQFKRDYKLCLKRGLNVRELKEIVRVLQNGTELPEIYLDHQLQSSKSYSDCRELHIKPNWLLIYKYGEIDSLYLIRTGTHSDLFK